MQVWSKISRMPAKNIKKMQDGLLCDIIRDHLAVGHPYYRELFKTEGIDPSTIKGREDLGKLPLTTKKDILPADNDLHKPKQFVLEAPPADEKRQKTGAFGLFGRKNEKSDLSDYRLAQLFYTAGRTYEPVPLVYARHDLENLKEAGMRAFDIFELEREHTILNALSFAPNVSFWQFYHSTVSTGATALQSGGGRILGMEKIILAFNNMQAAVLITHPGYALAALQNVEYFGAEMPSLERVVLGMDYAPMALVERIKKGMSRVNACGDRVQRIYFISEAKSGWAECAPGFGYHINPDHVLVEIVNPESGEPLKEGEAGEIVITNLDVRGTAFLRFRSGDIATEGITTEPCPNCGRTVPRILGDIERRELHFQLKTPDSIVNLNGNAVRHFMAGRNDVLIWYAEITTNDNGDSLKVKVKMDDKAETPASGNLERELQEKFNLPVKVDTCSFSSAAKKIGLENSITGQYFFDMRG